MNQYRQDPRLPFHPLAAPAFAQPGSLRLIASYGFDRGLGVGPTFAPNAQGLPSGWTVWDLSTVLGGAPWTDASRRQGSLYVLPNDEPEVSQYSMAGFIRKLPAAIIALPEFWIYSECGPLLVETPVTAPGDTNPGRCGLVLFPDEGNILPAGDPVFVALGVTATGDESAISLSAYAEKWSDHQTPSPSDVRTFGPIAGRCKVRWRVQQTIGITPYWSTDGEHWFSAGGIYASSERFQWLGFLGTAMSSEDDPELAYGSYWSTSGISIFAPQTSLVRPALVTQGGSQQV